MIWLSVNRDVFITNFLVVEIPLQLTAALSVDVLNPALETKAASSCMITTVGIDLAKGEFQIYGVDAQGELMLRKQLRRAQMA